MALLAIIGLRVTELCSQTAIRAIDGGKVESPRLCKHPLTAQFAAARIMIFYCFPNFTCCYKRIANEESP